MREDTITIFETFILFLVIMMVAKISIISLLLFNEIFAIFYSMEAISLSESINIANTLSLVMGYFMVYSTALVIGIIVVIYFKIKDEEK